MTAEAVERAKATLESLGYVVLREKSYRQAQERQRVAEALRAAEEDAAESARAWARDCLAQERRMRDRITHLYGVPPLLPHGGTRPPRTVDLMPAPLLFLDTETTGVELDADVWELAAIRREPDGTELTLHLFIEHSADKCARLPEPFATDHLRRYHQGYGATGQVVRYVGPATAGAELGALLTDRPHLVGAVPDFDAWRLEPYLQAAGVTARWHYHLIDVENLAVGYLAGSSAMRDALVPGATGSLLADPTVMLPPWDSNELSRLVGVPPEDFDRHTAMGDVLWAQAIYDAILGGA